MLLHFGIPVACVTVGIVLRRAGTLNAASSTLLSNVLAYGVYPALAFSSMTEQYRRPELAAQWPLPVGAFLLMALSALVARPLARRVSFGSDAERRTFGFDIAIPNYVFLPLPIAAGLWGEAGAAKIVLMTLGSEVAFWTVGVALLEASRPKARHFLKPPLLALGAALVVIALDSEAIFRVLRPVNAVLGPVGSLTTPLAMLILGYHLGRVVRGSLFTPSIAVLTVFRAVAVPVVTLVALKGLELPAATANPLFLLATMPVSVASVYMSDLFSGDPEYAARCVLAGHVISCASLPLWLWVTLG